MWSRDFCGQSLLRPGYNTVCCGHTRVQGFCPFMHFVKSVCVCYTLYGAVPFIHHSQEGDFSSLLYIFTAFYSALIICIHRCTSVEKSSKLKLILHSSVYFFFSVLRYTVYCMYTRKLFLTLQV